MAKDDHLVLQDFSRLLSTLPKFQVLPLPGVSRLNSGQDQK